MYWILFGLIISLRVIFISSCGQAINQLLTERNQPPTSQPSLSTVGFGAFSTPTMYTSSGRELSFPSVQYGSNYATDTGTTFGYSSGLDNYKRSQDSSISSKLLPQTSVDRRFSFDSPISTGTYAHQSGIVDYRSDGYGRNNDMGSVSSSPDEVAKFVFNTPGVGAGYALHYGSAKLQPTTPQGQWGIMNQQGQALKSPTPTWSQGPYEQNGMGDRPPTVHFGYGGGTLSSERLTFPGNDDGTPEVSSGVSPQPAEVNGRSRGYGGTTGQLSGWDTVTPYRQPTATRPTAVIKPVNNRVPGNPSITEHLDPTKKWTSGGQPKPKQPDTYTSTLRQNSMNQGPLTRTASRVSDPENTDGQTWFPRSNGDFDAEEKWQAGDTGNNGPSNPSLTSNPNSGDNSNPVSHLLFGGGDSKVRRPQSHQAFPNVNPQNQQAPSGTGSQEIGNLFGSTLKDPWEKDRVILSDAPSKYDRVYDEDPNKWVRHQQPLERLPEAVEVPLFFDAGDYHGRVKVGTPFSGNPEQELTVVFDTGSADMWVLPIEACGQTGPCTTAHHPFDKESSSTFRTMEPRLELDDKYVSGSTVKGTVATDTVKIGDGYNQIVIKNQAIGMASSFYDLFDNHDAIMGLTIISPQLIHFKPDPPLYQMTKQYGSAPVFGFYVCKYVQQNSRLLFGGGDERFYTGQLNFHPVVKVQIKDKGMFYNGWNIELNGFNVLKSNPVFVPVKIKVATVDSGAAVINGPKETMNKLNTEIFSKSNLQINNEFQFTCDGSTIIDSWRKLPDVNIALGGRSYVLWPSDYIAKNSKGSCFTIFMAAETDMVIIGRSFMEKYYTRFDQSRKGVEFAPAVLPEHTNYEIINHVRSSKNSQV